MSKTQQEKDAEFLRRQYPQALAGDNCRAGDTVAVKLGHDQWALATVLSTEVAYSSNCIRAFVKMHKGGFVRMIQETAGLKQAINPKSFAAGDILIVRGKLQFLADIDGRIGPQNCRVVCDDGTEPASTIPLQDRFLNANGPWTVMVMAVQQKPERGEYWLTATTTGGKVVEIGTEQHIESIQGNFFRTPERFPRFSVFFDPCPGFSDALKQALGHNEITPDPSETL